MEDLNPTTDRVALATDRSVVPRAKPDSPVDDVIASRDVESYASLIRAVWGRSAEATLEAASIVAKAQVALDHPSFSELAKELGTSCATLSKFITINSRRERFEACRAAL